MRNKHVLLLVALVAFLLPATAFAASVNVDGVGTDAVANGVQLKSAIASAQPGDVVVIPEGTYSVDQLVVAPSVETTNTGISLKGAGVDSTKIELTAVSDGVKITGKKDFSFEGFTIDGMKKSNYPLRIQGCQNVSLKNITVKNANKSAFDVNGSTDVTGEGLAAVNAGGYGIALNDASGTFTSCTTEGSSWGGISVSNRAYPGYPASSNVDVKGIQSSEYARLVIENYSGCAACVVDDVVTALPGSIETTGADSDSGGALVRTVYTAPRDRVAHNSAELISYLTDQQAGDVISLEATTYDIAKGVDQGITAGGQKGWYLPIVKDGVTIKGAGIGKTFITSSVVSANGSWASQDFFAIFANKVTISDMTITPKIETNKAIEVMGKDVMLKNLEILSNPLANTPDYNSQYGYNGAQYSGSIYFNPSGNPDTAVAAAKDVGSAVVRNVSLSAHISTGGATGVLAGTINLDDVNIDWTNFPYAAWDCVDSGWKVISDNPALTVGDGGFHVSVVATDTVDYTRDILSVVPTNTTVSFGAGSYVFKAGTVSRPINLVGSGVGTTTFELKNVVLAGAGSIAPSDAYVIVHPVSVSFPATTWTMPKGATYVPKVIVLPANTTDKSLVWSSDDLAVATVDKDGVITGVAPGITFINVKTVDGGISQRFGIQITNPIASGLQLNVSAAKVKIGQKVALKATIMPENARLKNVIWYSSNTAVATVSSTGLVTTKRSGTATITAKSTDNTSVSASMKITVVGSVTKITARRTRVVLRRGTSWSLRAVASPTSATNRGLSYTSTSKYVKVNSHGTITVLKSARHNLTATITIKAKDGYGAYKKVYVTVTKYRP